MAHEMDVDRFCNLKEDEEDWASVPNMSLSLEVLSILRVVGCRWSLAYFQLGDLEEVVETNPRTYQNPEYYI